jgi:flagellar biosynthesis protein FlhA
MTTPVTPVSIGSLPPPATLQKGGLGGKPGARWGTASLGLGRVASKEAAVPIAVLVILMAMITPLPPLLLDLLLSANITLSVIVLLVSMHIRRPAEFSVFPTTLLLMTLFRLALNISSSRLILLHGSTGTHAAGEVIEAFGNFVVGGNFIIGAVIFLVLIAIQYVVINHGAVRISEVTARFTLDALPGKQMSIDADLNAGLINEAEAKSRRKALSLEAEFYGAMDGATRFTQRDAVASILITAINILAGFLIGVLQDGMELRQALETYTLLTIGDGLVTVIPALMISISGGLIVTRASSEDEMGTDFRRQVLGSPQPLMLAAGVLFLMAAFPGLPKIPFLLLGGATAFAATRIRNQAALNEGAPPPPPAPAKENLESLLRVEPLSVAVGLGLVKFVEGGANSPLMRRLAGIRRQMAEESGFILPAVRVSDDLTLRAREYSVRLKGSEIARYELPAGCDLAIPGGQVEAPPGGIPAREPAFGIAAYWVPAEHSDAARRAGFTIVDPVSVLSTHLSELFRRHAHEVFSRQDAKRLLDRVADENPRVVEDLVPKLLPLAMVQKVLQNLLRERVSIRDAVTLLESLSEAAAMTRNPVLLTEYVRLALKRSLVRPYLNVSGELPAFLVQPALERRIEEAVEHGENFSQFHMPPQQMREFLERLQASAGSADAAAALVTSSGARYFLRQMIEGMFPNIGVLAHGEVPGGIAVVSLGTVG